VRIVDLYRIEGMHYRIPPNNNYNSPTIKNLGATTRVPCHFVPFQSEVMP